MWVFTGFVYVFDKLLTFPTVFALCDYIRPRIIRPIRKHLAGYRFEPWT